MANKIVLISDDLDFFDFIKSKLELRRSDELFTFSFNSIPQKLHLLDTALLIINSEGAQEKTLDLLSITKGLPAIVCAYNDDEVFRRKCYRLGMLDFITLLTPDVDFRARIVPALAIVGLLEKNKQYRKILVSNNIISENNEIFTAYDSIIDKELLAIHSGVKKAVFLAISPNEKSKFYLKTSVFESVLQNTIRKNDILMNYAPNKYFLLLFDVDIKSAEKIWNKIKSQIPEKIYAGMVAISNQKRQQLINEVLNRLHEAINFDKNNINKNSIESNKNEESFLDCNNFKKFKQEFSKKIEQLVAPVFYQVQQKYSGKLLGATIKQNLGSGYGSFSIERRNNISCFKISCPGFSKINIDITYTKDSKLIDAKRINLEPKELEAGLLEDLLEQFILEFKKDGENDA